VYLAYIDYILALFLEENENDFQLFFRTKAIAIGTVALIETIRNY
jgi:hypothetical protein